MSRFDNYLAVPFRHRGRDLSGADCFGLYALVLAQEASVAVADIDAGYEDGPYKTAAAVANALARGEWVKVDVPQTFDAAVMCAYYTQGGIVRRCADMHVGCMIDDRRLLHTEDHTGPRIVAIDDPPITRRIRFFARPYALLRRAA